MAGQWCAAQQLRGTELATAGGLRAAGRAAGPEEWPQALAWLQQAFGCGGTGDSHRRRFEVAAALALGPSHAVVLHCQCRLTGRHLYCFLTVAGISTVIMTRDMNNHESVPRTVTVTRSPAVSRRRPVGSDGPA